MRRLVLAICLWLATPQPGFAGAWLREEGTAFVSTGYTIFELADGQGRQEENTLFLEYGLRPRLTLGFSGSYNAASSGEGHVFLRFPIGTNTGPARTAVELGLGTKGDGVGYDPFLKTGVSWGRSLTFGERGGWINIDAAALWGLDGADTRFKLDATLGRSLGDRVQIMGQAFAETGDAGDSLTLAPSVIIASKKGATRFVIGAEAKWGAGERTGLRFGLWQEF